MLKIRLARFGKKKQPFYRIIVVEARSKRNGYYNDIVGWYNPLEDEKFFIDKEKYATWIKNGAQPSDAVAKLLMTKAEKEKKWPSKPKKEKKSEE